MLSFQARGGRDDRPLCQFDQATNPKKEERTKAMQDRFTKLDKTIAEFADDHKAKKLDNEIIKLQSEIKDTVRKVCEAGWKISDEFSDYSNKISEFLKQGSQKSEWDPSMCNSYNDLSQIEATANKASAEYLNVANTEFNAIKAKYQAAGKVTLPRLDQYELANKADAEGIKKLDEEFQMFWGAGPRKKSTGSTTKSAHEYFYEQKFIENEKNINTVAFFHNQLKQIQKEKEAAKARITVLSGHINDLKKQKEKCVSMAAPETLDTGVSADETVKETTVDDSTTVKQNCVYTDGTTCNEKDLVEPGSLADASRDDDSHVQETHSDGTKIDPDAADRSPADTSLQDETYKGDPPPIEDGTNTSFLAKNKNWLLLGGGAAVAGVGGYYLYKHYKKDKSSGNLLIDNYYNPEYPGKTATSTSTSTSTDTVVVGTPSAIKVAAHPLSVTAGQKSPTIVIEIHDSNGNKVDISGKVVSISCSGSNCSLGGITSVESNHGVAQFDDVIFTSDVGEVSLSAQSEYGSDTSPQKINVTDGSNRE
ncbi:MAG: hypothetical protein M9962_14950 [Oligoflexia bacterium]|nr:hypothetical protein [Oligoflexia bacterium]